jgi:tRNA dimethylallyltransferase
VRSADILKAAGREAPVLLAGPTASGKSALAMEIADRTGGTIVNADALQVFADWRILTARPTPADEAAIPHRLYGHVPGTEPYSVGHWLRDLRPLLGTERLVIVGGTGLYFTALTEGLAEIPATPQKVRAEADARMAEHGPGPLLAELDAATAARIDRLNPVRIQRAWEVQRTTGRGLAAWQDDTGPPLLPLDQTRAFLIPGDRDWLAPRIAHRFDAMLDAGVLKEARANRPGWSPALPSAKAIGAAELMAHLDGTLTLDAAREAIVTLTRQYAKRQRTWFRARMSAWVPVLAD